MSERMTQTTRVSFRRSPSSAPYFAPARRLRALLAGVVSLALLTPGPVAAQNDAPSKTTIIRDAEIEQLMREYTAPIFKAAGINASAAKIILVGDRSFNAFVANGQKIFINVGALMDSKTPNEIIGVLAHESGHIAGGHLSRLRQELARAQILAVAGMLVGAGAMVGTMNSGRVGSDSRGAMGAMLGPQELIRRSLLSYQRGEEQAADRAAVNYLAKTGQSARGLLATLERFQKDALFKSSAMDPYLLSHPLPAERISNLSSAAKASPAFASGDSPALQARHDMMRAKLFGFMGNSGEVARRYPASDGSLPARYARAIAAYKQGRIAEALSQVDALIAAQPQNAYFHELKGQALLESGRASQAVAPLRRAASLAPAGLPIRVMLGHALVGTGQPQDTAEAVRVLTQATQRESENLEAWQYLAMAEERRGNVPAAQLAAAQALFVQGKFVEARTQADRAQKQFARGTPGWLKADDILNYRPPNFN
ncbi:MAG: peptidase [Hyphomicrobiales bacterium]|nr:peptidase [Hyphomicrobiales bacterium]